jgi:taurine transport system permease protein
VVPAAETVRLEPAAGPAAEPAAGRDAVPGQGGTVAISVVSTVVLLFLWWLVTDLQLVKPLFLPAPGAILARLVRVRHEGFADASLWQPQASLLRVSSAFALACVTAVPVGIGMGVSRHLRGALDPVVEFYGPIPPLAYLPLTIIRCGIGETQKVVLIYLAIFAPMALAARAGVRSATVEQIHAALSVGASRLQVVRHVILPAALPEILTGMRIGIGFG